jgi:rhamnosyltransferase
MRNRQGMVFCVNARMSDQLRAGDETASRRPSPSPGDSVCAVVVTYRPGPDVLANLTTFQRQVGRVIVVDNASTAESRVLLAPWLAAHPGAELVPNPENRGIATALNQGVDRALAAGFTWVATFDQDSAISDGFVAGLLAAYAAHPGRDRIAVLAPLYRDRGLGRVTSPSGPLAESFGTENVAVSVTATSGNLVAAPALRAVGGFEEDFFIDCVDFEFCLRCRRRGWLILEVRQMILDHAQGRWERRRWLGRNPAVNDYNAMRRYYQARNRLVVYARYAGFDPRWAGRDAWGYAWDFLTLVLLCTDRPAKVGAMLAGMRDACLCRMGPRRR